MLRCEYTLDGTKYSWLHRQSMFLLTFFIWESLLKTWSHSGVHCFSVWHPWEVPGSEEKDFQSQFSSQGICVNFSSKLFDPSKCSMLEQKDTPQKKDHVFFVQKWCQCPKFEAESYPHKARWWATQVFTENKRRRFPGEPTRYSLVGRHSPWQSTHSDW